MRKFLIAAGVYIVALLLAIFFLRSVPDDLMPVEKLVADARTGSISRIEEGISYSKVHLADGSSYEVELEDSIESHLRQAGMTSIPPIESRGAQVFKDAPIFALVLLPFLAVAMAVMAIRDRNRSRRPPSQVGV